MKKAIYFSCTLVLAAGVAVGCSSGSGSSDADVSGYTEEFLTGAWDGVGCAVGQDDSYAADYLQLTFSEDGSYELRDTGTDSQVMEGTFSLGSDKTLHITSDAHTDDLLQGWDSLKKEADLDYFVLNDTTIALGYDDISYIFEKEETQEDSFSLLDQTVGDIWYSNDGSSSAESTYELSVYDHYFELYSIQSNKDPELITSFIYQSSEDSHYTFYTYRDSEKEFPKLFQDIATGFSSVEMDLTAEDNTLSLTCGAEEMTFSSNVIYGLETGSDAYTLCDTSFQWAFDDETHFCYFTMNPDTDTLYLYMSDAATLDDSTATACGEIEIDQKSQTITYHFDKESTEKECTAEDSIYKACKEMDGQVFTYSINDSTLTLTQGETIYNFPLEDF